MLSVALCGLFGGIVFSVNSTRSKVPLSISAFTESYLSTSVFPLLYDHMLPWQPAHCVKSIGKTSLFHVNVLCGFSSAIKSCNTKRELQRMRIDLMCFTRITQR